MNSMLSFRILTLGLFSVAACSHDSGAPNSNPPENTGGGNANAGGTGSQSNVGGTRANGSGGHLSIGGTNSSSGGALTASGATSASGGVAETGGRPGVGGEAGGSGGAVASGGADLGPRPIIVAEPGAELIKIDTAITHQTFEGWGTSLCWWANHVGGWDEANRNAVVDAVVNPVTGLGYNIFRYNIGGGENPIHEHMEEHREMPGFQDADGNWTFENDANQRALLLKLAESTDELILEAFSNSPPYWMTESGCASGSQNGSNNLRDDSYGDFAHYLTEVVKHYRDEHGIVFRTLEPLNEPNSDWWKADGSQEGCHFSPANQERLLQAVAQQLTEKALVGTKISASDENSMDDALINLRGFSQETLAVINQINVHSYAGSRRTELKELAESLGKRLWQSESGPLGQSISDDTEAALFMAERIIRDLRDLRAEAWLDWQSGDPSRSWASFTLNNNQQSYLPLKRFYMHAGFSRYIRPGATFVDVNHTDMVAAMSKERNEVTLVVRNGDSNMSHLYTFDLTSLPTLGDTIEIYRTSRTEGLEAQSPLSVDNYSFTVEVPAYSVSTFVLTMP